MKFIGMFLSRLLYKVAVVVLIIMGITWFIELTVISEQQQQIHWLEQDLKSCNEYNDTLTERLRIR